MRGSWHAAPIIFAQSINSMIYSFHANIELNDQEVHLIKHPWHFVILVGL